MGRECGNRRSKGLIGRSAWRRGWIGVLGKRLDQGVSATSGTGGATTAAGEIRLDCFLPKRTVCRRCLCRSAGVYG
jgi:hypothetical protein